MHNELLFIANISQKALLTAILLLIAALPFISHAHPGDDLTNANSCHHCWTSCTEWGEVYGTIHCHDKCDDSSTPFTCKAEKEIWESLLNIQELQSGNNALCNIYQLENEKFQKNTEILSEALSSLITVYDETVKKLEEQRANLLNELEWREENDKDEARSANIESVLRMERDFSLRGGFAVGNAALREIREEENRGQLSIQDIGKYYDLLRSDLEAKFQEHYNEIDTKHQLRKFDLETAINYYALYRSGYLGVLLDKECSSVQSAEQGISYSCPNHSYFDEASSICLCGAGYMLNKREVCVLVPKPATSNALNNVYAPLKQTNMASSSGLQDRTCSRVLKRFEMNSRILEKINERLMKRFGFACH